MHHKNHMAPVAKCLYTSRRMWGCLLLMLLLFNSRLFAQQRATDSLITVLAHYSKEDTVRLNLLNDIAFSYYSFDPDKGLKMADEAISLAKKLNDTLKLAGAYSSKGTNYWAKGDNTDALQMYTQSLHLHEKLKDNIGIAKIYNNLGLIYFGLSNYPKAIDYHEKALAVFKQLKDSARIAASYNNMGIDYQYLSDYPKALEYYLETLQLYELINNRQATADALGNIGIVYKDLKNYPKALEYHFKALQLYKQAGNQRGIANTLANIGIVYDFVDSTAKAVACFHQALQISETMGDKQHMASDYQSLGEVYYNRRDYSKALDYLVKSLAMYEQSGDKNSTVICLNEISNIYIQAPDRILLQLGIHPSERYEKALVLLTRAKKLAKETGAMDRQSETWKILSNVYEKQGDFKKALLAYTQYTILNDSVFNNQKEKEITRREIQYEYTQKEMQLRAAQEKKQALAAADIRQQQIIRNAVIGGSAVLLIFAVVVFIFYKRRRDAEDQQKDAEFKATVADTEMKALRLQMNPHFIFNSLNSIGDYMVKNDVQKADYYLARFAKVMRLILENSEKKEIPLADDLKALELYMQLESLRLNNKFTYEIIIDKDVDQETTLVPPLILQPFVENSIWHGIAPKDGKGKITIRIKKEENMINCIVEDNGLGQKRASALGSEQNHSEKKSMGVKITKSRIDIINKIKKTSGSVELADLTEGMRVEVRLPLELSF